MTWTILGWVAATLTVLSLFLIGSKERHVRRWGFVLNGLGTMLWGGYAAFRAETPDWPIVAVNAVLFLMSVRGFRNN